MVYQSQITGFNSPRYIEFANGKGFVTDLKQKAIYVVDLVSNQITHQIQFTSKHTTNTNGNKLNSSIVLLFVCGVSMFIYVRVYTHWRKTRDWCQHTFASLLYEMMESLRYCNACVKSL